MEDQQSTDTGTTDAVDTSTEESSQTTEDTTTDVALDVLSAEDDEETTNTEEATADTEEEESDATEEETEEESTQTTKPTKEEVAREAFERRQQAKAEKQAKDQETQQQYIAEGEDEPAKALRMLEVEAYNNRVEKNTDKLTLGYERAITDIDVFKNPSPEIKQFLDNAIDAFQAQNVRIDAQGNPVEVKGDIYQYLTSQADIVRGLQKLGARSEKVANAKSTSATIPPPSNAPKAEKVDPVLAVLMSDD